MTASGSGVSFRVIKNILKLTLVMAAQSCEYT